MGELKGLKISERRLLSHNPSFIPCMATMYSLSVVKSKTISCHFEDHDTMLPLIRKAYPDMARRSSAIEPLASAYPSRTHLISLYESQRSCVPAR